MSESQIEIDSAKARSLRISELPFMSFGNSSGLFRGTINDWRSIWEHRRLLNQLTRREIRARYKDSYLGILWSLFRPLVQLLIYYFAIGQILGAARGVPNFAIFVFVGLTAWSLFSEIISGNTTSILANSGLVKKVYLPREIFPFSATGNAVTNFFFQFLVLITGALVLRTIPWNTWTSLVPLAIACLILFASGLGLALAALNVYVRDTQHLVEVGLALLFWASPIVYPYSLVHEALQGSPLETIYLLNPVTVCILVMQRGIWGSTDGVAQNMVWPDGLEFSLLACIVVSIFLLLVSQRFFSRLQGNFAQEM